SAAVEMMRRRLEPIKGEHLDPNQKIPLIIALKTPHGAEEHALLKELDKTKQYPTGQELAARFAPSAESEDAIIKWASSKGLTVTKRFPGRIMLYLEGPVKNVESAFNVKLNLYYAGRKKVFANDRPPTVPDELIPSIQSIVGLDNLRGPLPMLGPR